jgi:hypothetical protein
MMARIGRVWPKVASGAAILAVAVVAGIISYSHIYDLTLSLHQSRLTARLMPIAIDGLITVGSVVLLQSGTKLGWLGIGPGLALSIFANLESGIKYGWLAATWAAIPAVSFFLASFILEHWLKASGSAANESHTEAQPDSAAKVHPGAVPEPLPAPAPESAPEGVRVTATVSAPKAAPRTAPRAKAKSAVRRAARDADPADLYAAELAAGELPSLRRIRADMRVGQDKAKVIQTELTALLTERVPVAA